ncbi:MAG TPA: hypothetical protein VFE17_13035 [Candidatus Baltobacteraceae bacterium]|jgi:hypothetical protein|nr:hypothetical protein [Candidatus Baltobacteraceae bacterium]
MACTAYSPNLTAREQAQYLYEAIPPGLFKAENEEERIPWRISPEPFALSPATLERITLIGNDLLAFYRALNALYNRSARGTAPSFIAEYLDQGKPEHIIRLSRQNRFKQDLPGVIRPDLILTEDGFSASELDSVPGGMGFVGAMAEAYCQLGMECVGGPSGIPASYAHMLQNITGKENSTVAIVVSDESGDYRPEMRWLAQTLQRLKLTNAHVCRPQDLIFTEEAMFVKIGENREEKIDAIYRNFELFDLMNVPKQELMLYAARHNRVHMTPPPKAQLEEKLSFALFHNPALEKLWLAELSKDVYARLKTLFPQTWIIDPRPLPPQAFVFDLKAAGTPVSDWMQLGEIGKSERDYVVKPSGFSELAWGSRGVRVANDLPKDEWIATLSEALNEYPKTPRILQRFHKGKRIRQQYFERKADEVRTFDGRVRLCPYYFIAGDTVELGGILATVAPADKRLIHGMSDAVMAPCFVKPDGN